MKKKKTQKKATTKKTIKKKIVVKKEKKPTENEDALIKKVKIKVIGIGGGGGNIVSELSKKLKDFSSQKIEFIAANTDNQALGVLSKNIKIFPFGQKLTRGLGAGRDVSVGEKAAREDGERIKALFSDNKDLYIIVSSLGGGTGTGAAPTFLKIASQMNLMCLGIFTLPFSFEGKKKMDLALDSINQMKENLNAYMVLPNEKIFGLTKEEVSFTDSLNLLNNHLANCLEGLLRTIYSPGIINIDWADIRTILEGKRSLAYLNVAKSKGSQNLEELLKKLIKNPILDYNFENADNIMFNIDGSKDMSLQSLSLISEKISELSPNARIIFGLTSNPKMKNEIKVTILSTGSHDKKELKKHKKAKKDKKEKKKEEKKQEIVVEKIRRTALEIKEAEKKKEQQEEDDEKIFEIPAFLRKSKKKKI
ncbi:MAG TPA: cell division protein FtsZ [Candidatus Pacearchaeota archaeon]|nr:cell division protein FtsZ [Candidatus Pacearchaeota archaeon]